MYNPLYESVYVLADGERSNSDILNVLEDANSPVTRKYQEKMYKAVLNKAHIDFGDIPKSQGNIRSYSGYPTMIDTLETIKNLATDAASKDAMACVAIVTKAIDNLTTDMMLASNEKVFEDILKDLLNKGKVKDDSLIYIDFSGDMIDKYGNKYESYWLTIGIYGSEVLKCDFDNLHSGDIFGKLTVSVMMPVNIRQDIKLDGSYSHLRPINN